MNEERRRGLRGRLGSRLPKLRLPLLPLPKARERGKILKEKKVCYYFNQHGGCPKTAEECWFLHKKLPAAEVAKMVQPPSRAASRANSPAGGGPVPKPAGPQAGWSQSESRWWEEPQLLLQICEAGWLQRHQLRFHAS